MEEAFQYVIDNGIMSEAAYPYKAKDSGVNVCNFEASESVAHMSDYTSVGFYSEKALQEAVAKIGLPVDLADSRAPPGHHVL